MIPPPPVDYPFNHETWGKTFRTEEPENWKEDIVNTNIVLMIVRWKNRKYRDFSLWEEFRESFEGWTQEQFTIATREALKELRTYLTSNGVWIRKQAGSNSYAKILYEVLTEEQQHMWTPEEIEEQIQTGQFNSELNQLPLQQPELQSTRTIEPQSQDERPIRTIERTDLNTPMDETPQPPIQPYRRFNDNPHPSLRPGTIPPQRDVHTPYESIASYEQDRQSTKQLVDLMKIYSSDNKKYGGEEYDILDVKLQVFYDCCTKVGFPHTQFHLAFSIMLKGRASSFYYDKISGRSYDFPIMVAMIKTHFETEERRQKYLTEWRSTTLPRTMIQNPEKTQPECLEILFDALRTTQRGLSAEYQNEHNLRDQVINACSGVPECRSALFRPAPTFEGVCAELRAAIGQFVREKELANPAAYNQEVLYEDLEHEGHQQYWTDRTYGGKGRSPARTAYKGRGGFAKRVFSGNTPQNQYPQRNQNSYNTRNNPPTDKKCFVCQKQGCWSTKHTEDERKKAYGQFLTESETRDNNYQQFLQDFEGSADEDTKQWMEENTENEDSYKSATFMTEFGNVNGYELLSTLDNQAVVHATTKENFFQKPQNTEIFTFEDRYSSDTFQGIMPDSGASGVSTAGEPQVEALMKLDPQVQIDRTKAGDHHIRFGKGSAVSKGVVRVKTPVGDIPFHVVPANTPFLYCLQDMDRMGVKLDNLSNTLIQGTKIIPIVRKWGHPWMLLGKPEETIAFCHLTETELRQLHRRFGHPSVRKLTNVLQRAGHNDIDLRTIERLTKFCKQCQLHSKSPGRFKFTLKDDRNFNFSVVIDVLYLEGKPVLQAVDEATAFNAARFMKDMSAKTAWDTVRTCWIDMYQGPPDYIVHDAGTNFASAEFRQYARSMAVEVKEIPIEAHNSIGKVERYHAPLRRSYEIFKKELYEENLDKETILQMAVKAVNDTAGPDGLVPTLLVFGAYPRISNQDPPSPEITKRAETVRTAMKAVRKLHAERQVQDALATRNGPNTSQVLDLPLQSLVRVWRERKGWKGPYKLLSIEGETCTIDMKRGPKQFRTTVVKPFHLEKLPEETRTTTITPDQTLSTPEEIVRRKTRPVVEIPFNRDLLTDRTIFLDEEDDTDEQFIIAVQYGIDLNEVFLTKKESDDLELAQELREKGIITTPGQPFEESGRKEIDTLIATDVFRFQVYDSRTHVERIFNSRLVHEVKGKATESPYEKSRLVIQAYDDKGKEAILTQSPTIQRASQRLILALAPSMAKLGITLFLRDVTQAYVQATTLLNRTILARLPKEIRNDFPEGTIMVVRKPLYGIPEAGTHWWATYYKHHREKLRMQTSSYDPCLLITTTQDAFGIVGMQTDDTLILGNQAFATLENKELSDAKIAAKPAEALSDDHHLIFNGCILKRDGQSIILVQKGQNTKLRLIDPEAADKQSQYREQRARGAYVATICQPEASFDLSVAAQHQDPTYEEIVMLNKRLKWQMNNLDRGIRYIPLDLTCTKLFIFVDGSFANNKDLSSQIGYEIILANETPQPKTDSYNQDRTFQLNGNLVHYSSTKSKRVTRSVLASEIYGMVSGVDMAIAINSTLKTMLNELHLPPTPIVVCTDSYSLYECLVKLGTTKEKRLMIDIMALRQSYERRELTEIRWINGQDNPADAMTKGTPNKSLTMFLDTNQLTVRVEGWVKRGNTTN